MVDLSDVQGYGAKFENQRRLLEESDIDDRDRAAISQFIAFEDATDDVNTGTLVSHLNRLRLSSERADVPLVEMDKGDVDALLMSLKRDHDLSEGTRRNYRKALRVFFDWRDEEWAEDIKIGASPKRQVEASELLSEDELDELLDATTKPRDKALIALLADTGLRIGAAGSLRIRDIDFSREIATVQPNPNGNVKDARDPVPLTWSRGFIVNWLDAHPESDNQDAPLFIKTEHRGPDEDGALTYQYLARRIKWVADEAGIDRECVNTHNFRKSAISRWIREGVDEQKIKHRVHWADDSTQFEIYSGVSAEEMNEDIAQFYGLVDETATARPEIDRCPKCRNAVRENARFCSACGAPLTVKAADSADEAETNADRTLEEMLESGEASPADVQELVEYDRMIRTNPIIRQYLD